ncbi:MAG: glycosyltransferase family 2 protein [Paludibacteraceae bacterium]|nr:glycosyltransferase family 2 protein [Paludibacteraceae bacterium]
MISIVIPLYNKAQSITNTIRSLQRQTYQDFEIVVVDGYSTDGSLEQIQQLSKQDPRIHVYMQVNRHGVTPARNETVEHAQAEHIAFIDADDRWDDHYLENLVALIHDYPQAGIWGMAYSTMQGEQVLVDSRWQSAPYNDFRGLLPANPWREWGCPFWTSATAISKKAFNEVGGFDNSIIYGEDIDLWYRLILNYPAAFDATNNMAYYRTDAENRACEHTFPLNIHIPSHIDKYKPYRLANTDFRAFFDRQMLYRLFPYTADTEYQNALKPILQQIDFSLQKKSMCWRFRFPKLYRFYLRCKGKEDKHLEQYQGGQ